MPSSEPSFSSRLRRYVKSRNFLIVAGEEKVDVASHREDWQPVFWGFFTLVLCLIFALLTSLDPRWISISQWTFSSPSKAAGPGEDAFGLYFLSILCVFLYIFMVVFISDTLGEEKKEVIAVAELTRSFFATEYSASEESHPSDQMREKRKIVMKRRRSATGEEVQGPETLMDRVRLGFRMFSGFLVIFIIAYMCIFMSTEKTMHSFALEYPLWCLVLGCLVGNLVDRIGGYEWLFRPLMKNIYIKLGLIVMLVKIDKEFLDTLEDGFINAFILPPIIVSFSVWFGIMIVNSNLISQVCALAAGISICGVSAAIATGSAVVASDSELTAVVAVIMSWTVLWTATLPAFAGWIGMPPQQKGAWIGSVIHNTGCVQIAAKRMGGIAGEIAMDVKMLKNLLLPWVVIFFAALWMIVLRKSDPEAPLRVLWQRFPKFVIGYILSNAGMVALSGVFPPSDTNRIKAFASEMEQYFFSIMFVVIGLQIRKRAMKSQFTGAKILFIYIAAQSLNMVLAYFAAGIGYGF